MIGPMLSSALAVGALVAGDWDASVAGYCRAVGEDDDSGRIQRAIDANPSGVVYFPRGEYALAEPLVVTNLCSLKLNKGAVLRAVRQMPSLLRVDVAKARRSFLDGDWRREDYGLFVSGGRLDGNGLAGCMSLDGHHHFTIRDTVFVNGRTCGLRVGAESGGYELMAQNLYFACNKSGLAGNVAVHASGGDSHYVDCIVVDYTVGFRFEKCGGNRLTRCHVWGGLVPPAAEGEPREMLKGSVCFWIDGASDTQLRDCFADTGKTGFLIDGWMTQLLGCQYFNNFGFKLDDTTVIDHRSGPLLVSECRFSKNSPNSRVYAGCGKVEWRSNACFGYDFDEYPQGMLDFATDQQSCADVNDWEYLQGGTLKASFAPGRFDQAPDHASWGFRVACGTLRTRFPAAGPGRELVLRARATVPSTKKLELTLRQHDGAVWGTVVDLPETMSDVAVPFSQLAYYGHWNGVPPRRAGSVPDMRKLTVIGMCYGKWLCRETVDKEQGFEVESIRIRR